MCVARWQSLSGGTNCDTMNDKYYPRSGVKKLIGLVVLGASLITSPAAITWTWAYLPSDANASNSIAASMNQAVAQWNTYSDYTYTIPVAYNAGVPTAQAS